MDLFLSICHICTFSLLLFSPSLSPSLSLSCCRLIPFWAGQLLRPAGFKLDLQHCSGTLLVLAALSQDPLSGFLSGLGTHGVWLFNQIIYQLTELFIKLLWNCIRCDCFFIMFLNYKLLKQLFEVVEQEIRVKTYLCRCFFRLDGPFLSVLSF